jgi:hypothetical protein
MNEFPSLQHVSMLSYWGITVSVLGTGMSGLAARAGYVDNSEQLYDEQIERSRNDVIALQ